MHVNRIRKMDILYFFEPAPIYMFNFSCTHWVSLPPKLAITFSTILLKTRCLVTKTKTAKNVSVSVEDWITINDVAIPLKKLRLSKIVYFLLPIQCFHGNKTNKRFQWFNLDSCRDNCSRSLHQTIIKKKFLLVDPVFAVKLQEVSDSNVISKYWFP